jgi:hypothetical protein
MVEEEALEVQRSKNDILLLNLFGNRRAVEFLQKVKEEGIADEAVLFDKVVSLFLLNISFSAWTLLLISWELLLQM